MGMKSIGLLLQNFEFFATYVVFRQASKFFLKTAFFVNFFHVSQKPRLEDMIDFWRISYIIF